MRARLLGKLAISALTGACLAGAGGEAQACSCAGELSPGQSLSEADVVFEGTVRGEPEAVRADLGIEGYTGAVLFRFEVARYFKGQRGSEAAVYSIDQDSACGRTYAAGTTYVVYGQLTPEGLLTDSLCSRTRPIADAAEDLALLGEGAAPDPGVQPRDVIAEREESAAGCSTAPPSSSSPAALGGALLSVLFCGLALARRHAPGH